MASDTAWELGSQIASKNITARRERKDKLEDEARQQKVTDLYGRGKNLALSIKSMAQDDPARQKAMDDLTSVEQDIASIYHPDNGGASALQKDWHLLAGLIHKHRPAATTSASLTATPGATVTPDAQTVTLADTPDAPIGAVLKPGGDLSASLSAVRAGTKLAPGTGTATQSVTLPSAPVTIPGTTYRPVTTAMTPQQRQQIARQNAARATAEQDVAAAGLSPEQTAQAESAQRLAFVRQAMKDYEKVNPNATSQEKASFLADIVQAQYGITQKPVWKEYIGPNGEKQYLDASRPESIPPGWNATGGETTDTRKRADYAAYLKDHPDYKGTFEQWGVEQGQLARRAVPTNRDDQYIAIEQKRLLGQPVTKDDQAHLDAYDLYINKRVLDPIRARAAAMADDRYVQVMDLNDPEKVTFMRAGDAARSGAGSPQSIGFQTDKAMTKYMTSGKGGENIAYFNTATDHLKLLGEAADALNNGDIQRLNQFGNAYARETGLAAPTNFETVKTAVSGELGKTFTGKGATVEEIAQINQTINAAESPEQLHGVIQYYTDLMEGKLSALKYQSEMGKQGLPAFAPPKPAAGGGATDMITMRFRDATGTHTGPIHRSQKAKFIQDHKGAVEVTSGAK